MLRPRSSAARGGADPAHDNQIGTAARVGDRGADPRGFGARRVTWRAAVALDEAPALRVILRDEVVPGLLVRDDDRDVLADLRDASAPRDVGASRARRIRPDSPPPRSAVSISSSTPGIFRRALHRRELELLRVRPGPSDRLDRPERPSSSSADPRVILRRLVRDPRPLLRVPRHPGRVRARGGPAGDPDRNPRPGGNLRGDLARGRASDPSGAYHPNPPAPSRPGTRARRTSFPRSRWRASTPVRQDVEEDDRGVRARGTGPARTRPP